MSKFGWDLPPGVTSSMLPGNDDPGEAVQEMLYNAFREAFSLEFSVEDVMKIWSEATEDAHAEAEERYLTEMEAEAELERRMLIHEEEQRHLEADYDFAHRLRTEDYDITGEHS